MRTIKTEKGEVITTNDAPPAKRPGPPLISTNTVNPLTPAERRAKAAADAEAAKAAKGINDGKA